MTTLSPKQIIQLAKQFERGEIQRDQLMKQFNDDHDVRIKQYTDALFGSFMESYTDGNRQKAQDILDLMTELTGDLSQGEPE